MIARRSNVTRLAVLTLVAGWFAPAAAVNSGAAQDNSYQGAFNCQRCHKFGPADADKATGADKYYQFTEYEKWSNEDKHSRAYSVLGKSNATSVQIGQILGINPETSDKCLSCHAVVGDSKQPGWPAIVKEGVSCEACHGRSSNWLKLHFTPLTWRLDPTLQRAGCAKAGMIDLRDPVVRADKCLSCHLGRFKNEDGKKVDQFVTHEMFAAGHPPVSGFEVETFLAEIPEHWNRRTSLPPEYAPEYVDGNQAPGSYYSTRMMVIGGLIALRNYAALVRDDAMERQQHERDSSAELALYDCAACHHELAQPSWRQQRGYEGLAPGRPRVRAWPITLARLRSAGADGKKWKELEALYIETARAPFGDPKGLAAAADMLWNEADRSARALAIKKYDKSAALELLNRICNLGISEKPDFDSARELGWSLRTIYEDLKASGNKRPQIDDALKAMSVELMLAIPRGNGQAYESIAAKTQIAEAAYNKDCGENQYNTFQQHLKAIAIGCGKEN